MGLLKSVSFNTECDLNIWNLFKKANELGTRLDYTLEIIDAAMHGRIDVDEEFESDKYIGRTDDFGKDSIVYFPIIQGQLRTFENYDLK